MRSYEEEEACDPPDGLEDADDPGSSAQRRALLVGRDTDSPDDVELDDDPETDDPSEEPDQPMKDGVIQPLEVGG
jgi:hypothetical protein